MIEIAGGCQCGAVRYSATLDNGDAYFCHCRMRQRATGGVAAALVNARRDAVVWSGRPRDRFASSAIAHRGFCALCGTPLTFEYDRDTVKLDLTVGSIDDATGIRLTSHFGVESRVPHWIAPDDLPEQSCADYAPLVARWAAAEKAE